MLRYGKSFNNLFIGLSEQFLSTVIRSTAKNIKDEQYLSLIAEYKLNPIISAGFLLNSNNYIDDRKLELNQSSVFNSSFYAKLYPLQSLFLTAHGGLSKNKQVGITDEGYIYGAAANLTKLKLEEFLINSTLKFQNEDILPRKNTNRYFDIDLKNNFENKLFNAIGAQYSEVRKDFYFDADSTISETYDIEKNIQSRTESRYYIEDRVTFTPTTSGFALVVGGKLGWRDIDRNTRYIPTENITTSTFDTKITEFRLDLNSTASYRVGMFNGLLRLLYSEREEKHVAKYIDGASEIIYERRQEIEAQKNNKSQLTTFTATGSFALSEKDNFTFSIFHRKLKYDTPSDQNYDDRDELLTILRLYYLRTLTPFFNLFFNLEGSINKMVYIYAERSSNNNVYRVLKFSSGGEYKTKLLTSKNEAIVSANYTVYDFEDINPNFRSFSFRQLAFKDSTSFRMGRNVSLDFSGYAKFSEQGDFNWTDFAGKPFRILEEIFLQPKLVYNYNGLKFGAGIRFFSLITFRFDDDNIKFLDTKYTSIGPLSEISYLASEYLRVRCYGWYEFINNEANKKREMANLFIQLNWNF